jgi:2-polyprenyl-6-hydroxyphenyl methylase/3-demethylubiquinone-9 3-methyltransferase
MVLELGCGYGRVLRKLQEVTHSAIGIDTSFESLQYGLTKPQKSATAHFAQMDAGMTGFHNESFDVVVCIQNGISSFKVDPLVLVRESLRVAKREGKCLFSTYSDNIWEERLQWFKLQAEEKLLGELDWKATQRGTIVCKDGFVATTFSEDGFQAIAHKLGVSCEVIEVDSSSLFGIFTSS